MSVVLLTGCGGDDAPPPPVNMAVGVDGAVNTDPSTTSPPVTGVPPVTATTPTAVTPPVTTTIPTTVTPPVTGVPPVTTTTPTATTPPVTTAPPSTTATLASIANRRELYDFLTKERARGEVVGLPYHADNKRKDRLYAYQGLVFRGDSRIPTDIAAIDGFEGGKDLRLPDNLLEAQGLLGLAVGATGQSGVSTAKKLEDAFYYCSAGKRDGYIYIVDTAKLPAREAAYDMAAIIIQNGYRKDDLTGGEVNVTKIPFAAVVGWIAIPNATAFMDAGGSGETMLSTLSMDWVHFNPYYALS
ncbi:hypothetical protein [Chitinimonas sp. BJB300]|uniref:hypothetical protein n=1 Tax=Chitinimonas sp. BJB300 TaxID=1559339 RepID=UPI00117E0246|nr:hypothetical protein [Chitinimonas sp. BJB300]